MSYIQITFSGKFDIADALLAELVTEDVFPTINSGVAQISQFIGDQGSHKYMVTFESGDGTRLIGELRSFVETNYPSITVETIIPVPAPEAANTELPQAFDVAPGEGVNG